MAKSIAVAVVQAGVVWSLAHPSEAAVLAMALRYATRPTLEIAYHTGRIMGPATAKTAWAIGGVLATRFPLAARVAKFGGGVGVGAVLGGAIGVTIARAGWGPEGQEVAMDFYSGGVSPGLWFDTVAEGLLGSTPGHRHHMHGTPQRVH